MLTYLWKKWTGGGKQFASSMQEAARRRAILRLEPLEDRCLPSITIAEYPVVTANSSPVGITTGPDGNVWFTEFAAGKIGVMNSSTHAVSEFSLAVSGSGPDGIVAGPDGNIWFTEFNADKIGELVLSNGQINQFTVPTANAEPAAITIGPDGNLWFTENGVNQIGTMNLSTHAFSEFSIPTASSAPQGITSANGMLWFTETSGNNIGSVDPSTGAIAEHPIPLGGSQPFEIAPGPNGTLWFTESAGNAIGEFNIGTGAFSSFAVPTANAAPLGITEGYDGNIWFTEYNTNNVGEVNLATGAVTEYGVNTPNSNPGRIIAGPADALWYAEANTNQIGEIAAATINSNPVSQSVVNGQTAVFTAAAVGFPAQTVRWEISTNGGSSFSALSNGGMYSGVNGDTLTITGATTSMNDYQYEAVFTDGTSQTVSANTSAATLTVTTAMSISPAPPQGVPGKLYDHTISVIGDATSFSTFSISSFNPGTTGLTASDITTVASSGQIIINGTPTGPGNATFVLSVATTGGDSLTETLTISIDAPLSIVTSTLAPATAGIANNQSISVAGGVLPYTTFSVSNFSAGTTGLTAADIVAQASSGIFKIVGTPTAMGTASFTVTVADSNGDSVSKTFTLTVESAIVFTASLPQGTAGSPYNQTLTITGGSTPYSSLTVNNFSAGTTGLTLSNFIINVVASSVTIKGTPPSPGNATFTVTVVDAIGGTESKTYTVSINAALTITSSLPQGTAGYNYDQTIAVNGGTTPYTTFSVTGFSAGTTGLTAAEIVLNAAKGTIVIDGRPSAAGTVTFTVNVADSAGGKLTKTYTITINPLPTIGTLTTTQWTEGLSGFNGVISISGGTVPFTIASTSGLPTGLTAVLNGSTVSFTGTPTVTGTFASGSISLHDAVGASVTRTFSITINPALTIGNPSATQWTSGISGFVSTLTVSGGTGALSLASASGLPAGLSTAMSGNTVRITGEPSAAGAFAGSVTVRDADGATVTKTFTITINAPPSIGNLSRTQWTEGAAGFSSTMTISAGTTPFTIAVVSGLPTGVTAVLSGDTIILSGTPSVAGTFASGSITLHDSAGATVTKTFSIVINPPLQIVTSSLPAARMAALYDVALQSTGGTGSITFAIVGGSLPPGMKLSSNGVITGVSRGFGTFTVTIEATDSVGATFIEKYVLSIAL